MRVCGNGRGDDELGEGILACGYVEMEGQTMS
jgi:hypothetical protein